MREMKDSGIEWIGEIPIDWTIRRLRFMCNIVTGNQDTQDNDPDGQYPFYVRSPIVEKSNKYTFEGPAILMSGDGAGAGRIFHMVDGKYGCHQRVYSIQNISGIDRRVLYHYMSNLFWIMIETANSKSTVDSVRLNMLQDFPVLIPPDEEQEKLSRCLTDIVSRIDNIIFKTHTSIEEYKKLKQAIISQAVTKGLDSNAEMKNSGIEWVGDMPANWNTHPIYYSFGERKNKNSFGQEKNLLSLSYGNIIRKNINSNEGLLPESFNTYNIVEAGDIIIRPTDLQNDKRSLRTGIAKEHGIITSAYITLMPIRAINAAYYHYQLHAFDIMKVFYNMGNGVRQGLNFSEFSHLRVIEPPREEQDAIVEYLDDKCKEIDNLIAKKEKFLVEIENYKKSLIYEYVTGKKEVPETWA